MTTGAHPEHAANEEFERVTGRGPTRWEDFTAGRLPVADLDDDEVEQMRVKGRDGRFHGKPPGQVPRALLVELQRRHGEDAVQRLRGHLHASVDLLGATVRNTDADLALRVRSAAMIIERVLGKVPDRVEFDVAEPAAWERLFTRIAVEDRPAPNDPDSAIVDVEPEP